MIKTSFWISLVSLVCWVLFVAIVFAIEGPPSNEDWTYILGYTFGVMLGSFGLSYLGGHILKGNKGAIRVGVLVTVLWVLGSFVSLEPYYGTWSAFIWIGVIPIIAYWGILWVIMGFQSSRKKKENS